MRTQRLAILYARLARGAAFLSAVAARFGLWHDRGPHPFAAFIQYTGEVNSFLPSATYPFLAVASTIAETTLGILLIIGFRLRWTALASAILLALFGMAMAISGGIKSPLDYSVFSASAAALLLAEAAKK
ncbi:MAG: putative oxidoreductase [Thermoanaerobaculia bacterium]|nr:putative oxidoreductase [Thermoanaerobaculia bacterium]